MKKDNNYPLVTMTMGQYEEQKNKIEKLQNKLKLANDSLKFAMGYFDSEEEKSDFLNYLISHIDENNQQESEILKFIEPLITRKNETKLEQLVNKIHEVNGGKPLLLNPNFKEALGSVKVTPNINVPKVNIPDFKS